MISVYCIDEPELHLNPAIHGKLLDVILAVLPKNAQLWLATHSIGHDEACNRHRAELAGGRSYSSISLTQDFDQPVSLTPLSQQGPFGWSRYRLL